MQLRIQKPLHGSQHGSDVHSTALVNGSRLQGKLLLSQQKEINSPHKHGVWALTELPEGRKVIVRKWVFKVKHNADGSVEKHKARLVAQGFSQKYGVDYNETFSPVVQFESLRTVIALAVKKGLKMHQLDVNTAFLHGELEEEVYMRQPEGFVVEGQEHLVCKLNKSLYGLQSMGFVQTPSDPCIYVAEGDDPFMIAVHVDDLILAGTTDAKIAQVKQSIAERFDVKDMGVLNYFLGMQVIQKSGKVWIGQPTYAEKVLSKFGMDNARPVDTPVDPKSKLIKAADESELHNQPEYQSAVGSLLYLSSATRPDITFTVNNVAKCSEKPTKEHWSAVKRIFRYLKGTVNYGLQYSRVAREECVGFRNADWAGNTKDRKSVSGYLFQLNGCSVSWRSKKQPHGALSTAEAEYIALSAAVQEALWMKQLLIDLNVNIESSMTIYEDNKAAISMSKNPQFHGRAKHVDIKRHFLRDHVYKGSVNIFYCPTGNMLADLFTTGLSKGQFRKLLELTGVTHKPS